ncbi:MAG: hypothetical protein DMF63_16050 [Acidobacteria bacterium]|nr:MAG: hypothetical protein DMF63_16050 [Acidobacteriota bacterium]
MLDIFRTLPGILGDMEGVEVVREAVVFAAWRRIAGESLTAHAVPLGLENKTLRIAVSNLNWQRNLKDQCGQMLFKLNAALGSPLVTFIELQIDEQTVLKSRTGSLLPDDAFRAAAQNEISDDLTQAAAAIEDEELRRQFLLAAGSCLVRRKQRSAG